MEKIRDIKIDNDIIDKNVDYFFSREIINKSDVNITKLMNNYKNKENIRFALSKTISSLGKLDFVCKKEGLIVTNSDKIQCEKNPFVVKNNFEYIKKEIPIIFVTGGAAYQLISDFFVKNEKEKIEYFCPVTYDYDISVYINRKMFFLEPIEKEKYVEITEIVRSKQLLKKEVNNELEQYWKNKKELIKKGYVILNELYANYIEQMKKKSIQAILKLIHYIITLLKKNLN